MTKYVKSTCELCEKPVSEDQGHIMETESASLLIHKSCAMRLMRGVWDEQVLRSTIPLGDSERLQKGNELLISNPQNAPFGFVWFSDEDELNYTPPALYASDLLGKSLVKKSTEAVQVSPGDSYIDEDYMEDYDRLQEEWTAAVTAMAERHGRKNPVHKGGK